ncbi:MAG: YciI-like protein [Mycobacteriales bacterium]
MYFALIYDLVEDYLDRRPAYRDEHLALAKAARERGDLALAGALVEPADRALLVWDVEDAAPVERFVQQDPYVTNGLVTSWAIRPWNVVVGGAADAQ